MRPAGIESILEIENDAQLTSICSPTSGQLLWPLIRWDFLSPLVEKANSTQVRPHPFRPSARARARRVPVTGRAALHNLAMRRRLRLGWPIVLVGDSAVRMSTRDGRAFNPETDLLFEEAPSQTVVLEELSDWDWPFPRAVPRVVLQTPARGIAVVRGRLRGRRDQPAARALVDLVASRAHDLLGLRLDQAARDQWVTECVTRSAKANFYAAHYRRFFQRIGCHLVVKNAACYGGPENLGLIRAARNVGVTVAETQHGVIHPAHAAYNFADRIAADPNFKATLPDHLLTYGSWWGERVNVPVHRVVMGNPHRSERLAVPQPSTRQRMLLVLGDGASTEATVRLCAEIRSQLPAGWSVVFRPHPAERVEARRVKPSLKSSGVRLDENQDIYDSFLVCTAVLAEVSTGLLEAIGLVPKIYAWDTPRANVIFPADLIQRVANPRDLVRRVIDEQDGAPHHAGADEIWAPHWRENYGTFVSSVVEK